MPEEISITALTEDLYQIIVRGKGFATKRRHVSRLKSVNRLYALILFFESIKMPVATSVAKYYAIQEISAESFKNHIKILFGGINKIERNRISSYIDCIVKNI